MSHQGYDDWFPECLLCGHGNLGSVGIVCLDPTCHEYFYAEATEPPIATASKRSVTDGHHWASCACCDKQVRADAGSWGTYAICIPCFRAYFTARRLPPSTPTLLHRDLSSGILRFDGHRTIITPSTDR